LNCLSAIGSSHRAFVIIHWQALAGEWHDHRDCHSRPDLILIYRKSGDDVLQLVRIGSHSELGL